MSAKYQIGQVEALEGKATILYITSPIVNDPGYTKIRAYPLMLGQSEEGYTELEQLIKDANLGNEGLCGSE